MAHSLLLTPGRQSEGAVKRRQVPQLPTALAHLVYDLHAYTAQSHSTGLNQYGFQPLLPVEQDGVFWNSPVLHRVLAESFSPTPTPHRAKDRVQNALSFFFVFVLFGFLCVVLAVLEQLLHSPTPATASTAMPIASLKLSWSDAKNMHREANKPVIWHWACSSVVGHLLSVHRALDSIPCTVISKTNKKQPPPPIKKNSSENANIRDGSLRARSVGKGQGREPGKH